jgi:hypothetical protein
LEPLNSIDWDAIAGSRCPAFTSLGPPGEALPAPKSAPVGPPYLSKVDALLASAMNQPPPSGGEFGRLTAIYLRIVIAGFSQVKESFELFELF